VCTLEQSHITPPCLWWRDVSILCSAGCTSKKCNKAFALESIKALEDISVPRGGKYIVKEVFVAHIQDMRTEVYLIGTVD
jgi:hypothetical protein